MATNIKLKRSATSGATPSTSDLELGELALNTYDGKMYMKKTVSGSSSTRPARIPNRQTPSARPL